MQFQLITTDVPIDIPTILSCCHVIVSLSAVSMRMAMQVQILVAVSCLCERLQQLQLQRLPHLVVRAAVMSMSTIGINVVSAAAVVLLSPDKRRHVHVRMCAVMQLQKGDFFVWSSAAAMPL